MSPGVNLPSGSPSNALPGMLPGGTGMPGQQPITSSASGLGHSHQGTLGGAHTDPLNAVAAAAAASAALAQAAQGHPTATVDPNAIGTPNHHLNTVNGNGLPNGTGRPGGDASPESEAASPITRYNSVASGMPPVSLAAVGGATVSPSSLSSVQSTLEKTFNPLAYPSVEFGHSPITPAALWPSGWPQQAYYKQ